ncbi:MAG: DEAD/DEAH box helicase, partial [Clostridia bacterium]
MLAGNDCLAQAPTGTGKTAAFGIPVINMIEDGVQGVQAVILCPTRELVLQLEKELKKISAHLPQIKVLSIYGGENMMRQLAGIRKNPQIVIGTTGRVMDHLRRKTLKLSTTKVIVLDEADEMLNMGFREDIDTVLASMPAERRTLMFSATMPKEILQISRQYQTNPVMVKTTIKGSDLPTISQKVVYVAEKEKYNALKEILTTEKLTNVIVFCNTRRKVDLLNTQLNEDFFVSLALHGELQQRQRDKVMRAFRGREANILVATDVAARGIDVEDVQAIFNYDMPLDDEYYIHRIGRTARATKSGVSYSFATRADSQRVRDCERIAHSVMETITLTNVVTESRPSTVTGLGADSTRFFLTVGEKDFVTRDKLITFISSKTSIKAEEIFEVKIMELFSFVEVASSKKTDMLTLNGEKAFKRTLAVEEASASRNGGRSNRSSGNERATKTYDRKPREFNASSRSFGDKPRTFG